MYDKHKFADCLENGQQRAYQAGGTKVKRYEVKVYEEKFGMNVLVIDVGTSSMRGILFDHQGKCLTVKQEFYQATYLENSWVEQNPADWENALYSILKQSVAEAENMGEKIDAISITSQRSSVIPVDENIRPLSNAIMWQDKRTNHICESMEHLNDKVFSLCGSRINPVFSGSKMMWIREERPEIYAKTYKFMVIPDYLIYLMTGRICTDYTYGSRSLLMNIRTHEWDDELLEIFHVEKEKLCELTEVGSVCGHTTKAFAEITGGNPGNYGRRRPAVWCHRTGCCEERCHVCNHRNRRLSYHSHRQSTGESGTGCNLQLLIRKRPVHSRIQRINLLFRFRLVPETVLSGQLL